MYYKDNGYLVSCGFDGKIRVWDWGNTSESSGVGEDDANPGEAALGVLENDAEGKESPTKDAEGGSGLKNAEDNSKFIVREFSHESQFRCLAYYPGTKHILVGTEGARILSFPLVDKKRPVVGDREDDVVRGGADDSKRAPRSGQLEENS